MLGNDFFYRVEIDVLTRRHYITELARLTFTVFGSCLVYALVCHMHAQSIRRKISDVPIGIPAIPRLAQATVVIELQRVGLIKSDFRNLLSVIVQLELHRSRIDFF